MGEEIANSEEIRDIKWDSYIFDGTEDWHLGIEGVSNIFYYGGISNWNRDKKDDAKVTHFVVDTFDETVAHNHYCTFSHTYSVNAFNVHMQECGTVAEFKAFLASEYAKGTPVTVYYPRTSSTTTTIESPEILTVKGSNIIEIETEVQPSNISITYLSSGFEPQPLKTADGQILHTNNNQIIYTLE